MKLGIMCHSCLGGSVRIAVELAKELSRRGHRVHLFTLGTPFSTWGDASGVISHHIPMDCSNGRSPSELHTEWLPSEFQAFLSCILKVIKKERLDILHWHYAMPFAFLASEVKNCLGYDCPKLVGTLHGTDVSVFGHDPVKGFHISQSLKKLDALTTVSISHAELAANIFGLSSYPVVIPNFVDLSRFHPIDYGELDKWPSGHREQQRNAIGRARIVHISNLRSVKNPESVAHIFLGIRQRIGAELLFVGDGPGMETISSILAAEGCANDLVSWGLCDNVAPILAHSHLLIMPSQLESFCIAALEAMACGLPVIATHVGGLPEVVVHGKTGFLFPLGHNSLAVKLAVHLLSNEDIRIKMAKAAALHARKFDQREIISRYEILYAKVIHKSTRECLTRNREPFQNSEYAFSASY